MKPRSELVSAALLVALLGGATACGGSDDKGSSDGSSSSAGNSSSTDAESNVGVAQDLPKNFPGDISVVGKIGNTITVSGTWTIKSTVDGSVGSALKSAGTALTDNGFKAQIKPSDDGTRGSSSYGKDPYYVQINAVKKKDKTLLIYLVGKS